MILISLVHVYRAKKFLCFVQVAALHGIVKLHGSDRPNVIVLHSTHTITHQTVRGKADRLANRGASTTKLQNKFLRGGVSQTHSCSTELLFMLRFELGLCNTPHSVLWSLLSVVGQVTREGESGRREGLVACSTDTTSQADSDGLL